MMTRIALALLLAWTAPVAAQTAAPPSAPAVPSATEEVRVALDTSAGRIVLALDRGRAPATTANFLHYVESGKLNGESFYRAMRIGEGGLIQGGITSDARKLAPPVAHEPPSKTGLKHVVGAISMASYGPGTARSDFFIMAAEVPSFDDSFAVFGRVVEGMDVVKKILALPVSPTKGEGTMKGQMLEPSAKIVKASRFP